MSCKNLFYHVGSGDHTLSNCQAWAAGVLTPQLTAGSTLLFLLVVLRAEFVFSHTLGKHSTAWLYSKHSAFFPKEGALSVQALTRAAEGSGLATEFQLSPALLSPPPQHWDCECTAPHHIWLPECF